MANIFKRALSLIQGLGITGRFVFRPTVTIQYPKEDIPTSPAFRGPVHMIVDPETNNHRCVACLSCQKICPTHAIPVIDFYKNEDKKSIVKEFVIDDALCCYCGLCVDVCTENALEHLQITDWAVSDRSQLRRAIIKDEHLTPQNNPVLPKRK